jgi:hypothetical protein
MSDIDLQHAVKQGRWYAGGLTPCPVRIVRHHTLFGTHDPEDPPDIAADVVAECYYVRYHPPGVHEYWHDGGVALTLREAIFLAERKLGPRVQWDE